jgi:hypothetical protein
MGFEDAERSKNTEHKFVAGAPDPPDEPQDEPAACVLADRWR